MPALKNLKHEKLARALIVEPTQTDAYLKIYPNSSYDAARSGSSGLLAKTNIRERVLELLEQRKAGLQRVSERMRDHLESQTESISLDTCKTILKVAGAFDQDTNKITADNIQINIVNLTKTTG